MKLGPLAAVALATACTDPGLDVPIQRTRSAVARRGGPLEERIVGGTRHAGNPEVPLLALLDRDNDVVTTCSGTLIQPRLVLTAAHCVDGAADADEVAVYFGTDATTDDDPGFRFLTYAESVTIHPHWDAADVTAGSDLALVELLDEVPIEPARLRTAPLTEAEIGQPLELVGWGRTRGDRKDGGVKRRAVSRLGHFDDLLVEVGNSATNTCNGDSGGPAFLTVDGAQEVVGITSYGDERCTEQGLSTRVDVFAGFITGKGDLGDDDGPGDDDGIDPPSLPEPGVDDGGGCGAAGGGSRLSPLLIALAALLALPLRHRRNRRRSRSDAP